jgi:hypothetical protein
VRVGHRGRRPLGRVLGERAKERPRERG